MDDREKPLMDAEAAPSLQRQLARSLFWACLAIALVSALLSLLSAYHEAGELQDELLQQTALALENHAPSLGAVPSPVSSSHPAGDAEEAEETALIVQSIQAPAPMALPPNLSDGLHDLQLNDQQQRGQAYRVLIHHRTDGQGYAVAQRQAFRQELALASAVRTILPLVFLLPVLLLLIGERVRSAFAPVRALASQLAQRRENDLHAMPQRGIPRELLPFVQAINQLLARVGAALHTQRRFVADAAHELRTPLTALGLQAEHLAQCPLGPEAQARLATLQGGIARQSALVSQLLDLSRVQAGSSNAALQTISLLATLHQVLQDCLPLAQAKHLDLGVLYADDSAVLVQAGRTHEVFILLRNLIGNAIAYTPAGGRIDISLERTPQAAHLIVSDTGPGIAEAERERVLQPFYRVLGSDAAGSGLGLAIVQSITQRMGAALQLDWADAKERSGLRVQVDFPNFTINK